MNKLKLNLLLVYENGERPTYIKGRQKMANYGKDEAGGA